MDRIVTIDHPYEMVTFDLRPLLENLRKQEILTVEEWNALHNAEQKLYKDEYGAVSYTDVSIREESQMVRLIWDRCEAHMDGDLEGTKPHAEIWNARIARRVARVLGIIAFGTEFVLR
jgi:hypothetical protein